MCQYPPDGLMSPGSARPVPVVDGAQTGRLLDENAADLALRATHYLRTRFRDRVTMGDLSAHLAYSPSHLTRVFTAAVGTSPMDYCAMSGPRPALCAASPTGSPSEPCRP